MSDAELSITEQVQQFQQAFTGPELDIIALTGANSASLGTTGGKQAWNARISITAWRLHDHEEVQQGEFFLTNKGERTQLELLFNPLQADQIWQMTVRHADNRFLLLKLKQQHDAAQEPKLAKIREEQTREVNIKHERLGTFMLDRRFNTLRGQIEWLGETVGVSIDYDENMQTQFDHLIRLLDDAVKWDKRIRTFAAEELTELKNDSWLEEDEQEWSKANVSKQLSLQQISFSEQEFTFWFDDGDLFWGHAVCVNNTVEDGPYDVSIMG
ncbi:DUF2262 domain-containing protein [Paenibacillus campi]|uniref:DUF2262 domain-containing protein n=1 Tax=Paenibacillus campi TaxID=3106031 RepID=UPI002AFFB06B|nr:DUF2262 domain-containing protein [Paenibacillus sp. SGZ-1009]